MNDQKMLGEKRRNLLLEILKNTYEPITGSELAKRMNVSRQVIVNDVSLLKAKSHPIIATSQGYLYLDNAKEEKAKRIIACYHTPEQTEDELNLMVDHGVTVEDVKIEHPIYGDLTASVMVSNRLEVQQFLKKMKQTNASYLLELTDGTHLHTVSASNDKLLDKVEKALEEANFLVKK